MHKQLLRKLTAIHALTNAQHNTSNDEENVLPEMPIEDKAIFDDFERLLRTSDIAVKQFVS